MSVDLLITRTNHDNINYYLYHWTEEIINLALKKGMSFIDIKKENVNKKNVSKLIRRKKPKFIIINGHGNPESIYGHDNKIIFNVGENHDLLVSKIVYARSCHSAQGIGKKCEETDSKGCYIGYSHEYCFIVDQNSISRPLKDQFAKPFMESSNIIPKTLIKGHTAEEAMKRSENIYWKYIEFFESQDIPGSSEILFWLKWDLRNQMICGNKKAKIS